MLLNYTTKIDAEQTISEIQKMLTKHGVTAMMTEYDGPQVSAVSFKINTDGRQMGFKLPCNWMAVKECLRQQGVTSNPTKLSNAAFDKLGGMDGQAVRVAWRIIREWVEAQCALVEVGMVTVPQVFLPYAIMRDGRTLAEHAGSDPNMLLGPGN